MDNTVLYIILYKYKIILFNDDISISSSLPPKRIIILFTSQYGHLRHRSIQ